MPTILICEDDPAVRRMLEDAFAVEDFDIEACGDGEGALGRLDGDPVDVVLLDIMMPGVDGYEVLEELQARPDWAATRVIVMSALDDDEDVWRGWAAGVDYYMTKPFDLGHLRDVIHRFLHDLPVT